MFSILLMPFEVKMIEKKNEIKNKIKEEKVL